VLFKDLSLNEWEMLVTLLILILVVLLLLGLVKHLLLVVVAQEFLLQGSSTLSLVVFLLGNLLSNAIQELFIC
jgi:hypothetical protein